MVTIESPSRRRELGEALWRVVLREGIESASVRKVAAEAGISMCGYGYRDPADQIAVRRANCGTRRHHFGFRRPHFGVLRLALCRLLGVHSQGWRHQHKAEQQRFVSAIHDGELCEQLASYVKGASCPPSVRFPSCSSSCSS